MRTRTKTRQAPYLLMLIGCHECITHNLLGARTLYFENPGSVTNFLNRCIGTFESAWLFSSETNLPLGFYLDKKISLETHYYLPNVFFTKTNRKGEYVWAPKLFFDNLAELIDNI